MIIRGVHEKLWKLRESQCWEFWDSPLGSPETKSHLDVAPMGRCKVYYKGEGDGFQQVWAVVNLVSSSCPWLVLTPKVLQLCTNHLLLILYRFVWVVEACQFFLVPSRISSTPFYPSKVLRAKERASTPCSFVVFCLGLTFGVPQRIMSASWTHENPWCISWHLCYHYTKCWLSYRTSKFTSSILSN